MLRQDFVFCIGFSGNTAIVDGKMKTRYGRLGPRELAEKGLYKQAVASALSGGAAEELAAVADVFNRETEFPVKDPADLKRVFGVYTTPELVKKAEIL
jgi:hypothetical protein